MRLKLGRADYRKPFYKFTERRWAERMVEIGEVQIGTLHSFRKVEQHGSNIGDAGEGTITFTHFVEEARFPHQLPERVRGIINLHPSGGIGLQNITLMKEQQSHDLYVYCMALENVESARTDPKYDTVVEIREPIEFVRALTSELLSLGLIDDWRCWVSKCFYGTREVAALARDFPPLPFLKPKDQTRQREVRAVWHPKSPDIKVEVIQCQAATHFLRIL